MQVNIGVEKRKYTYEDYAKLPEGAPYQLIGGQLVRTPSPVPYHQDISRNIEKILLKHVTDNMLGKVYYAPLDVHLDDEEIYQPDVMFVSNDRLSIIGEKCIQGAPDLIVEILSPATAYYDIRKKYRKYEEHGVREYWIVDPEDKSVEVHVGEGRIFKLAQSARESGTIKSHILSGLAMSLEDIFKK
jgi:Uma2 family endonuclease